MGQGVGFSLKEHKCLVDAFYQKENVLRVSFKVK